MLSAYLAKLTDGKNLTAEDIMEEATVHILRSSGGGSLNRETVFLLSVSLR